jgi:glycerol dehydrogenase-like iron-containing ADH family enzyme
MTNKEFQELKKKIIHKWKKIIEIAATVPPAHQIVALLQTVTAPVPAAEIGLTPKEVRDALRYSHYLRSQFTVLKLSRFLGLL